VGREWLRTPEEWGVEPVPPDRRRLRLADLGILWFSLGVGLLVLFTGALLVLLFGLSLFEVLVVSVAGSVIGSLMLAAAGNLEARHGVPTMVSLRPVLGRKASWAPSALNAFQLLGWASFELMVMGLGLGLVSGPVLGGATAYVWIGVLAVWVAILALGGPLVVVRIWLERVAVWLVLANTAYLTYVVVTDPVFAPSFFTGTLIARFGAPLHFTETTILSGDRTWEKPRGAEWPSTPEGEAYQAEHVVRFYTMLFSHPAVEAITWWDFADLHSWKGAPAGFVRKDMSPKPAYDELKRLIKGKWWTNTALETGADGTAGFRGLLGDYKVTVMLGGKKTADEAFTLKKGEANRWSVTINNAELATRPLRNYGSSATGTSQSGVGSFSLVR